MPGTISEILIPANEIQEKVRQLGARISSDFRSDLAAGPDSPIAWEDRNADDPPAPACPADAGRPSARQAGTLRPLILTGVLKGALFFLADLSREISVPVEIEYMSVSSYGKSTRSSGVVRILKDLDRNIAGADVLLVEDIVDTGLTLDYLLRILEPRRPRSLKVCSLLEKPARRRVDVPIDYVGFSIPDEFVVGYGLDYDQQYRNLPYIAALKNSDESPGSQGACDLR